MLRMGIEIGSLTEKKMQTKLNKIKSVFQMDRDHQMEQPFTFEVLGIKIFWSWFCLALTEDEHLQEPHFAAGKTKPQSSWNVACSGQHKGSATKSPDSWLLSENLCSCDPVPGQQCGITGEEAFCQYSWHSKCLKCLEIP